MRYLKIKTMESESDRKLYHLDDLFIHANFQILVDYIEKYKGFTLISEEIAERRMKHAIDKDREKKFIEEHNEIAKIGRELYKYWTIERPKILQDINNKFNLDNKQINTMLQSLNKLKKKDYEKMREIIDISPAMWVK